MFTPLESMLMPNGKIIENKKQKRKIPVLNLPSCQMEEHVKTRNIFEKKNRPRGDWNCVEAQ